ncbi:RagB/SusD family nutrient uptake outer membrane protein [Neolewinella aurantiaca]|uniref:RagB/SusD family nutrient uptake outer membrane protein n=1 Tax=Neolewinella aurantiaca TaxID=2602767 RepID=A0A5C7FQW2_9BACT|nr:RagB/SusD family nutrient uptake outer membrane protein [Neolewinella aurantiaca]TXF90250.1 RagB/SusD family nutrient uptake outer membrane protein [Neolewinella aurantiaca]
MKYLNKVLSVLAIISLSLGFVSCDEFLDEQPFSQVGETQFWQTAGDVESGIAATYDAMQQAYRTKHYLWGEFRSDNHIASDRVSGANSELVTNNLTPGNSSVLRWNDLYLMIGRANLAIQQIPDISGVDDNLLGEAYAMRAYAYFDAVRVWGSAPLYTEPVTGLDQDLKRPQTDGQTLLNDVVIPDMLRAEELISIPSREFRFSKASVLAFQAHVYMWIKDYAKANEAMQKLIDLNEYSLVTSESAWQELFLNDLNLGKFQTGPELIFSIRYDILEDGNGASGIYSLFFAGVPSFFISPQAEFKWIEKFPVTVEDWTAKYPDFDPPMVVVGADTLIGDYRYYLTREDRSIGEARVAKYNKINFSNNDDDTNISVYRYAGILLLKALAENRLDNPEAAAALVTQVRNARGLPPVTVEDMGDDMDGRENFILDERQFELFAEGDRWWDLRMTDKVNVALDTIGQVTDERLLFPVWEGHLIDNENLTQNPGY